MTKIPAPAVSVVTLTFNSARLLQPCLDSLKSQTFKDFEVVIIDGGSTDGTEAIALSYSDSLKIRFLRQTGKGLAQARNDSLSASTAELVAFLDSDDTAKPERLERQVNFLRSNQDYVAAGSWLEFIDSQGRPKGVRKYVTADAEIREAAACYNPFPNAGIMFRRAPALKVGAFQCDPCEDYDFYLRLMQEGKVCNLPEPLTHYRLHEGGSKASGARKQIAGSIKTRADAIKRGLIRPTFKGRLSDLAHHLLLKLPPKMVYAMFELMVKARRL